MPSAHYGYHIITRTRTVLYDVYIISDHMCTSKPGGEDIIFFFNYFPHTILHQDIKYIKIRNKYNFERIKEENRNTDIYTYINN